MGGRGREFVARNYSVERLVEDVLRLYEELTPDASVARAADVQRATVEDEGARSTHERGGGGERHAPGRV